MAIHASGIYTVLNQRLGIT